MKHNRLISYAVIALVAIMGLSSCNGINKLKEMKVTSAKIVGISPNGLKGINLDLALIIDNPGFQITLSEISCQAEHFGKIIGTVAVDPFTLHARSKESYYMKAGLSLSDEVTLLEIRRLLDKKTIEEMTVDLHAKVKLKSGIYKTLVYNDVPLKKLLDVVQR